MDLERRSEPRISDTDISDGAPRVRALVANRLETLWRAAERGFVDTGDPDWRPDIRAIEAGIKILRNLGAVYRLDLPAGTPAEAVQGVSVPLRDLVASQLQALEARIAEGGRG